MHNTNPRISVIMPCFNEEKLIKQAIKSLQDDYFSKHCEIIIVDGMSNDRTQNVTQSLIKKGLNGRLFENKKKIQAYGLNLGISKAKGKIIIRADAHCLYPRGYIRKCVELLEKKEASNVGGIMYPRGLSSKQKAIAMALRHPMGVGNAKWHLGNYSGYADTVYLGTFWKQVFEEIGLYDTNCKTNEDAELNLRLIKAKKKIYLDNSIKVTYFPRNSLKRLSEQYFKYGKGRGYTILKHKKITSWRQLGPVGLIIGLLISIIFSLSYPLFLIFPLFYLLIIFFSSLFSWPNRKISLKLKTLMSLAIITMHLSWGIGFLFYFIFRKQ